MRCLSKNCNAKISITNFIAPNKLSYCQQGNSPGLMEKIQFYECLLLESRLGFQTQTGYAQNQFVNFHFGPEFLRQITVNTSDKLFFNSREGTTYIFFLRKILCRGSVIQASIFKAKNTEFAHQKST